MSAFNDFLKTQQQPSLGVLKTDREIFGDTLDLNPTQGQQISPDGGQQSGMLQSAIGQPVAEKFGEGAQRFKEGLAGEGVVAGPNVAKVVGGAAQAISAPLAPVEKGFGKVLEGSVNVIDFLSSPIQKLLENKIDKNQAMEEMRQRMEDRVLGTAKNVIDKWDEIPDTVKESVRAGGDVADLIEFAGGAGALSAGIKKAAPAIGAAVKDTGGIVKEVAQEGVEQFAKGAKEIAGDVGDFGKGLKATGDITDVKKAQKAALSVAGEKDVTKAPQLAKGIKQLDTKDVKTYTDLENVATKKIDELAKQVDTALDADKTVRKASDLKKFSNVDGDIVEANYVERAIDDLKDLYTKTGFDEDLAKISKFEKTVKENGITNKQLNDFARKYGTEFKQKAFDKKGDIKQGLNAQRYESTRSGLKDTVRQFLPDGTAKELDLSMSEVFKVKESAKKMKEAVQNLENKIKKRGLVETVANKLVKAADVVTLRAGRGALSALFPSNVGLKQMNSLDIQKMLQKNLKKIQKLNKIKDSDELLKGIDDLVDGMRKEAVKFD